MTAAERRASPRRVRTALVALLAAFAVLLTGVTAEAQQRPRTVLEMLFGGGQQAAPERPAVRKPVVRKKKVRATRPARQKKQRTQAARPKPSGQQSAAAAVAAPASKNENAKTVLVAGDFLAASLADGLSNLYADNEMIVIEARTDGSSGLVREDHYDWTEKLGPILDEAKPAVLVMMLGSNDRQPMTVGSRSLASRSEEWVRNYEERIGEITEATKSRGVPLVWVGMPPFKFDRMSEDMVFLNDLYRKGASSVSGEYVDIWDGFVDADGGFVYSGPGVNGQTTQLRNSDGITMTNAGEDKLAFFAERAINRLLGTTLAATGALILGPDQLPTIQLPPIGNAANALQAAPVSIDDPSLDGPDMLLGTGSAGGFSLEPSPRERLVINGGGTGGTEGRADNFAWSEKSAAVTPSGPPIVSRGSLNLQSVRESGGLKPPEEMPTILDAIIEDWSRENEAARPE
ncbi:MAG: SGNH family hydrolase [Aurantimonas endophytica]|uniref:SGNH/GDSL hydrolase family protein n=1 Tax=Aurantimonas endophytica TaxID=1522175 RepID=UPI00300214A8